MAKPRIFISSTFYDLRFIREDLGRFVKELGFEPVLFEKGHIPYGKQEKPSEYCYKEIELCDILVSIIGGRYGSESSDVGYSITQKELRRALDLGKQVYIFIEKNVKSEYGTYKLNKDNTEIKYRHADDRKIYEFLDEIYALPKNNTIFGFESSQDIVKILKEQWAGLFQRLLGEEASKQQLEMVNTLKNAVSTLQQIVTFMSEKEKDRDKKISEIIYFNHPAFLRMQHLLDINYKVVFITLEELNKLLEAHDYEQFSDSDSTDSEYMEWVFNNFSESYIFKVSKNLFDESGHLKTMHLDEWDDAYIYIETVESDHDDVGHEIQFNEEDIPF